MTGKGGGWKTLGQNLPLSDISVRATRCGPATFCFAFDSQVYRGDPLPLTLTWEQVALRLALATLAGVVFGVNRLEHGRAAGLRTNILVCLAAAVAMVQVNLLLT